MQRFSVTGIFSFLILFFLSCNSQAPSSPYAPEEGTYTGGPLNITAAMNYGYNPITGFGVQAGTSVTPGVNVMGELIITSRGNNKGAYSFSKWTDWEGEWQYDPDKDRLHFTGPLEQALLNLYYHAGKGYYSLQFVLKTGKDDKKGLVYYFSKKASKDFPKPARPNADITGLFTIQPDINTVAFFNAATGTTEKTFAGKMAATNGKHYTIDIGFTDNTKYYQIGITDLQGKSSIYSPSQIMSYQWHFLNYKYGILNTDATRMALLGSTPDSYANLSFTPGVPAVGIFDLSGNTLGILPRGNTFVIPGFLPDGRLVYASEDGIAITDADYKNSKKIYDHPVNAIAVSADGKRIAFSEGLYFFTINTDGTGKKQVVCEGEPLEANSAENVIDMHWSPDGKYIGISYKMGSKNAILIVPLDGSGYRFLRDEWGEILEHTGEVMSWH